MSTAKNILIIILVIALVLGIGYFLHQKYYKPPKVKGVRFDRKVKYREYPRSPQSMVNVDSLLQSEVSETETSETEDTIAELLPSPAALSEASESKGGWDKDFGKPIVSKSSKRKYAKKLMKSHKRHLQADSDHFRYMTDKSSIIEPDRGADPMQSPEKLRGMTIGEVYDRRTAPVKFRKRSKEPRSEEREISFGATAFTDDF